MTLAKEYYKHTLKKQQASALNTHVNITLTHGKFNINVCQNLQYGTFKHYGYSRLDQLFEDRVKGRLNYYLDYLENMSAYKNGYENALDVLRTFIDMVTRECKILLKKHPIGFWDQVFGCNTKYMYHDSLKYIVEQLNQVLRKLPNNQPPKKR